MNLKSLSKALFLALFFVINILKLITKLPKINGA